MNSIIIDSTIISIKVSLIAVLITFLIAISFVYFNNYKKNRKKNIIDIFNQTIRQGNGDCQEK